MVTGSFPVAWPATPGELIRLQERLAGAAASAAPWSPAGGTARAAAGVFVCFPRGLHGAGQAGDPGWAAAALLVEGRLAAVVIARGEAPAAYEPGLLALREGPLLEAAVRALPERPEVLLVDATGRDHPRRAGLALHLGALLDLPTIGVTDRPLVAHGPLPADRRGAASPLCIDGEVVAHWLRTKPGTRPLAVHAAWRTDPETAVAVIAALPGASRTPEPLRQARRAAREARARKR